MLFLERQADRPRGGRRWPARDITRKLTLSYARVIDAVQLPPALGPYGLAETGPADP
jgi:hypothetical protein